MSGPTLLTVAAFTENLPDNSICVQNLWRTLSFSRADKMGCRVGLPLRETTRVLHAEEVYLSEGLRWGRDARCVCKYFIAHQTDIQTAFVLWIWLLTPLWLCQHMLRISAVDYEGSEVSFAINVQAESKSVILMGLRSFGVWSSFSLTLWKIHHQDLYKSVWSFQAVRGNVNPYPFLRWFTMEQPKVCLLGATYSTVQMECFYLEIKNPQFMKHITYTVFRYL